MYNFSLRDTQQFMPYFDNFIINYPNFSINIVKFQSWKTCQFKFLRTTQYNLFCIKIDPKKSYTKDKLLIKNTATNNLWKPTFTKKMVFINRYGFPLQGNFWQNLKSCFQPQNWKNFSVFLIFLKFHVHRLIIGQPKPTNF